MHPCDLSLVASWLPLCLWALMQIYSDWRFPPFQFVVSWEVLLFTWSGLFVFDDLQRRVCVCLCVCVSVWGWVCVFHSRLCVCKEAGISQTWLSWPHFRESLPLPRYLALGETKGKYLYIIRTANTEAKLWGQSHSTDTLARNVQTHLGGRPPPRWSVNATTSLTHLSVLYIIHTIWTY